MEHGDRDWKDDVINFINHRQRQILVHSIIYYKYDQSLISDDKWSRWAKELCLAMSKNCEISKSSMFYDIFKDFDYSTGMNLPMDHEWGNRAALRLLRSYGIRV